MNLDARLRKLESAQGGEDEFVVIWSGIGDSSLPENCVYFGNEYEMVTSTTDEAARRLARRVTSNNRPMLFLLNKRMTDGDCQTSGDQ